MSTDEPTATLEALLLSMAAELRPIDATQATRTLTRLATTLAAGPTDSIAAVGDILGCVIGFRPTRTPGPNALLLNSALRDKQAEPAMLAAIYAMVANRAGIPLNVVATGDRWLVARERLVLDPVQSGALLVDDEIPPGLRRLYPHEIARALLTQLIEAYAVQGDLRRATRAAELRQTVEGQPSTGRSAVRSGRA